MKKEIKLTKKSFLGYILILVGLALLTSPLILRSYNDIRANASKKVFEKQEAAKSADLIEEENKKAQAYNEIIKNSDMSVQDPFTTDEYENGYDMFTKTNTPFAYLSIPKLDKYLYARRVGREAHWDVQSPVPESEFSGSLNTACYSWGEFRPTHQTFVSTLPPR